MTRWRFVLVIHPPRLVVLLSQHVNLLNAFENLLFGRTDGSEPPDASRSDGDPFGKLPDGMPVRHRAVGLPRGRRCANIVFPQWPPLVARFLPQPLSKLLNRIAIATSAGRINRLFGMLPFRSRD